ncbi:hypothetical protein Tco_1108306 [Tanacetum coccineum]
MRKHGYGYLQEIMVRRADNDLYRFKEGDFPCLRINDIEDMLLLNGVPEAWLFRSESKIFNSESKVTKRRSTSPSQKLPNSASGKETHTLHIKTLKDSFMSTTMGETVFVEAAKHQVMCYLANVIIDNSLCLSVTGYKALVDSLEAQVDQGSQIKMIQVKEMMQDNDLKNSKSKDKGSKSRSQSMDEQSHYKQDKTITRQSINVKRHIFNVIGGTEEFEERDLNIGGDC